MAAVPGAARAARANRAFLRRVVHYLAADAGISQFLDIGTGFPVAGHVHEVALAANPAVKVVYADNDPVVVAHARARLADGPSVVAVEGDARFPRDLLSRREVGDVIDFGEPVAVLLIAVLHFVSDEERPWSAVQAISERLAPGSYVAIAHVTSDGITAEAARRAAEVYDGTVAPGAARSEPEILRFFTGAGLELISPGLVSVETWRSGQDVHPPGQPVLFWAGVGRKPGPGRLP